MTRKKDGKPILSRICANCGYKVCTRCREAKPPSEFHCNPQSLDGLQPSCRPCLLAYKAERKAKKPLPPRVFYKLPRYCPRCELKTCGKCGQAKPTAEFRHCADRPDQLDSYCRACKLADESVYREQNYDQIRAIGRAWDAAHRQQRREYRRRNHEKRRAYERAWEAKNRERLRQKNREAYQRNREYWRAYHRAWDATHPERRRRQAAKRRAARERERLGAAGKVESKD